MAWLLLAAVLTPALITLACLLVWRLWRARDRRRSPLTIGLVNLPGEGLRRQVAKHDEGFAEAAAMAVFVGPIVLGAWLIARVERAGLSIAEFSYGTGDLFIALIGVVMVGWAIYRLIHHARLRRRYLNGLRAEMAVAQCLTPLIAEGAMVFHDFPTGKYNIDHIVIGRSAVFAIETKWRSKPAEKGRESARVRYDGNQLLFPRHAEAKPIEQAAYQADWLATFLAKGVGKPVRVIPVVALPGWYVENVNREGRSKVLVSNCHNAGFMTGDKFGQEISRTLARRVAHVLAQHYPAPEF